MAKNSKINGVMIDVFSDVNQAYIEVVVSRSVTDGGIIYSKEWTYCHKNAVTRGMKLAVALSNKRHKIK